MVQAEKRQVITLGKFPDEIQFSALSLPRIFRDPCGTRHPRARLPQIIAAISSLKIHEGRLMIRPSPGLHLCRLCGEKALSTRCSVFHPLHSSGRQFESRQWSCGRLNSSAAYAKIINNDSKDSAKQNSKQTNHLQAKFFSQSKHKPAQRSRSRKEAPQGHLSTANPEKVHPNLRFTVSGQTNQSWRSTTYWEHVYLSKKQSDGHSGAIEVWRRFDALPIASVPCIYTSRPFFLGILSSALQDADVLLSFCRHLQQLQDVRGWSPPRRLDIYGIVMRHVLSSKWENALEFHKALQHCPLTEVQFVSLFKSMWSDPDAQTFLQRYTWTDRSFSSMNDPSEATRVLESLREEFNGQDDGQTFTSWRERMSPNSGEPKPAEARSSESTTGKLEKSNNQEAPSKTEDSGFPEGIDVNDFVHNLEQAMGSARTTSPSDSFCARLLATRFFSIPVILDAFLFLQVSSIGPSSLREILLRCSYSAQHSERTVSSVQVARVLDELKVRDIKVDDSRFYRFVRYLVKSQKDDMLYHLAMSDQHPDEMEDLETQEKLLAHFLEKRDAMQTERTLEVLLFEVLDPKLKEAQRSNLLIRSSITRGDILGLKNELERARAASLGITRETFDAKRDLFLQDGNLGKAETKVRLTQLAHIGMAIMQSDPSSVEANSLIPPSCWSETLNGLLKTGALSEYGRTAVWLAEYYSNALKSDVTSSTDPTSPTNIQQQLHNLFPHFIPARLIQAGLAWNLPPQRKVLPQKLESCVDFESRAEAIAGSPLLWGLRVLRQLTDVSGVVRKHSVRQACCERLWGMFLDPAALDRRGAADELPFCTNITDKRIRRLVFGSPAEWVRAMELAWREDIFRRGDQEIEQFAKELVESGKTVWEDRQALRSKISE